MKRLIIVICLVLSTGIAHAQTEISYDIQTVETPGLMDINKTGDLIAMDFATGPTLLLRKNMYKPIGVGCPGRPPADTLVAQLNNQQDVGGTCTSPTGTTGFVRHKDSSLTIVNPPGSVWTDVYALSDKGDACGRYFTSPIPGQSGFAAWHGFCWERSSNKYTTIDFPIANAVTVILGINKHRQMVGAYFTYDLITNETSEWTAFTWSNGIFGPLAYPNNGSWTYPLKLDNDNGVLLMFDDVDGGFQGGPSEPGAGAGYGVFDDGHFFRIVLPTIVNGLPAVFNVNGRNDRGQLTGEYRTFDCTPGVFLCRVTRKGFIASPK